jgi:hypothetical protein
VPGAIPAEHDRAFVANATIRERCDEGTENSLKAKFAYLQIAIGRNRLLHFIKGNPM